MTDRPLPDTDSIRARSPAALARLLTGLERSTAGALELLEDVERSAAAPSERPIVLTGPPGVGKSTLVRGLIGELRARGEPVAVLACDPASPYTGGAFLGDRLRWSELTEDAGVFARSIAHRSPDRDVPAEAWLGARLLGAVGFPWVLVETVGAGQVVRVGEADSVRVVVLAPGQGDQYQMLKAGLLESGDVYVVNRCDTPGAERWARQLEEELSAGEEPPVVLRTTATTGSGVEALVETLSGLRRGPGDDRAGAPGKETT